MRMQELMDAYEDEIYEYWRLKFEQGLTKLLYKDWLHFEFDYSEFYDWIHQ